MSKGAHSTGFEIGGPKSGVPLRNCKDTSESWVLVMVERHFSTYLQGFLPNEKMILRSLGQHASESPSKSAS